MKTSPSQAVYVGQRASLVDVDVDVDGNTLRKLITGVRENFSQNNDKMEYVLNNQETVGEDGICIYRRKETHSAHDDLSLSKGDKNHMTCINTWPGKANGHARQRATLTEYRNVSYENGINSRSDHNNNQKNGKLTNDTTHWLSFRTDVNMEVAELNVNTSDSRKCKLDKVDEMPGEAVGKFEMPEVKPSRAPSTFNDSVRVDMSQPKPLDALLESIPLAYNPQTKQLHLIKKSTNPLRERRSNYDGKRDCELPFEQLEKNSSKKANDSCFSESEVVVPVSNGFLLPSPTEPSSQLGSATSISNSPAQNVVLTWSDSSESCLSACCVNKSDEAAFTEITLENKPSSLSFETEAEIKGAKPKRQGLPAFFTRNFLPWRSPRNCSSAIDEATGWKLFGKNPSISHKGPSKISQENHDCQTDGSESPKDCLTPRRKRGEDLVATSTTALILENRPSNLPSKDPEEEVKHRLEYQQMVEAAKKKEIKEAKLRKKLAQHQLKHEEQLSLAAKCWNTEILPNWEISKSCRKAKKLWWQGIPPSVRGKVWKLAIGNDLHVTPELYEICVSRAKDRIRMALESISVSEDDFEENIPDKESSVELIKLDVSRTFPQLCIFQKGGPCYDQLHSLLGAYVCYRPDVGYMQGMSFLAAVLILNLEVADAFICFSNLLNKPCQLAFFRLDEQMMRTYFTTYELYFSENLPKLYNHFTKQNLTPDLYLIDWIYTLYSRSLPLDVACRVWDVYFRDGDEFLFRTAIGILRLYEDILLNMEFIHLAQFLTKLPEDIEGELLFKSIENIRMVSDKRSFVQVLQSFSEPKST